MQYILLAIISNNIMSFSMKYSETHRGNRYGVTVCNYATGFLVSWLMLENKNLFDVTQYNGFVLGFGAWNAALFVGCLLLIQHSMKKNGLPMTVTFNRLGIIIPTVLSAFLFAELPSTIQIVGLVLAVIAIIYINHDPNAFLGMKFTPSLICLFCLGGMVDMTSKVFTQFAEAQWQSIYLLLTFGFAFLISLVIMLYKNPVLTKMDLVLGILVGVPNQLVYFAVLKASSVLPAYLTYPLYSAGALTAANIVNYIVFREPLKKQEQIGIVMIIIALIFINL